MEIIKIKIDNENQSLLAALRDRGYFLPADCGGRGTCGKCKVRILRDEQSNAPETGPEILACKVFGEGSYPVVIPDYGEDEIWAIGLSDEENEWAPLNTLQDGSLPPDHLALAVDLGTTTIAAGLTDTSTGEILRSAAGINHQRVYGADVLLRMDAANRGEGGKLQELVMKDLNALCSRLGLGKDLSALPIPVIISGNTTMEHLLQGLSCRTLGVYPFQPVDITLHTYRNMTILPGISTFVGADIVSGIVACQIDRKEEISILVDLGTNGEMIIGNKDRILAASTAAGPAFEGGNISCGLAGVPGAIDRVVIEKGKARVTTIGGKSPAGLCGTGVLETVYEMLKDGIIDETGLLEEAYFDNGFPRAEGVVFTAKDIREVQLAKAAIRAGIEVLLSAYGVSYGQIDRLYLAGGFGQKLDAKKAIGIGMLPEELADRIVPVGNTSLKGAVLFARDPDMPRRLDHVIRISEEITLSNHQLFNDLYVEHMFFPE
ncbi:MAG: DUF4445 domain-containing protein [Eubacterium sp.]|nr:DUF4445 domain-containing protein [Eubacterium sp.]